MIDEVVTSAVSDSPDLMLPMLFLVFLFLIIMFVLGRK